MLLPLFVTTYIFFFIISACFHANALIVNEDVQRSVDATHAILRIATDIKCKITDTETPQRDHEYLLSFTDQQAAHISFLSVTNAKGKELQITAPTTDGNITTYAVQLPSSSNLINLKVLSVFTSLFVPYPASIKQNENQMVILTDSHVFFSPYETINQKTTIKLSSGAIESFTKRAPFTVKGSIISLGPYKNIPPLEISPFSVHFVHNKPFAKFSWATREVEISHWGRVSVEEAYELQHTGAKLEGGFSRFDYQAAAHMADRSSSFRTLTAALPINVQNIYYRDQIGNISTSELSKERDHLSMEVTTRFPLFGGWQTQFYLGYTLPTTEGTLLTTTTSRDVTSGSALPEWNDVSGWIQYFQDHFTGESRLSLSIDYCTVFDDVWVDDMTIKIVLPEGSRDISVTVPYPTQQSRTTRFTYLDSTLMGGRPVINLMAKNIVEEHDEQIIVSYTFSRSLLLIEPLMVVCSIFLLFLLCSIIARLNIKKSSSTRK